MELNIHSVTTKIEGLKIVDKASEVDGQVSGHSGSALQDSIQELDQSAQTTSSQAQQARILADSLTHLNTVDIIKIYPLFRIASEFKKVARVLDETADALCNAAELSIITTLTSLGVHGEANVCEGSLLQRMLSHFNTQIRSIIRDVLSSSGDADCVLWKIAEECYKQATSNSGALHPSDYSIERDEASLECPYDPDFEAEESHEPLDRLNIDEDHAKAWEERMEHRREERKREERSWIGFWVLVLHGCPNGPTLFYPPASNKVELQMFTSAEIPRYLYRTFDEKSSGRSDDEMVASIASLIDSPEGSRKDLLCFPNSEAINMLHGHLTNQFVGGAKASDNLMSWTSSLLFALQYAIYRRNTFGYRPADIKICVIDTRRFPQGQFAPDLWLLEGYRDTAAQMGGKVQNFFHFRLTNTTYYNGEFLSQGSVDHTGRSCVVSLKSLEESGLYDLYPEFAAEAGKRIWTNRVRDLRKVWCIEQQTTLQEIQLASGVARKCFSTLRTLDMTLILLTLKARKTKENLRDDNSNSPVWACKPVELERYISAARLLKSRNQNVNGWNNRASVDRVVGEMFE